MASWKNTIPLLAIVLLASCGMPRKGGVTECVLPEDQQKTFLGKWAVTPIPMAVSANTFSQASDRQIVAGALETWNRFSEFSWGISILDYWTAENEVRTSSLSTVSANEICRFSLLNGDRSSFRDPVVIHKRSDWSDSLSSVIALTTSCAPSGSSDFQVSMIEINTKHFFAENQPQPDVKSVLVHEVGHMLGLGHSCEFSGSDVPDCNSARLPKVYKTAVMYPSFDQSGTPRSKLNGNDMGRANCLYQQ